MADASLNASSSPVCNHGPSLTCAACIARVMAWIQGEEYAWLYKRYKRWNEA